MTNVSRDPTTRQVDQTELRVNSMLGITVLATAYVLDLWPLVALQAGVFLLTTLRPGVGPYVLLYRHLLRPSGLLSPDVRVDNPEPHQFATLFGTAVSMTASSLLATGHRAAGWGLAWLIISLGAVAVAGWCAGCFTYYWMNRLGLRRLFRHAPIAGTFPGARPPKA